MTAWPPGLQRFRNPTTEMVRSHDELVLRTDGIDRYCSSTRWMLPAYEAFSTNESILGIDLDGGSAIFQESTLKSGHRALLPLEAIWQLGCPVAATHPRDAMKSFVETLLVNAKSWDFALLCGIEPTSVLRHAFNEQCKRTLTRFRRLQDAERDIIHLHDGDVGWLARRSAGFRAKLRRACRQSDDAGISFLTLNPVGEEAGRACFARLLDIERTSWKAEENTGLLGEPMRTFTQGVLLDAAMRSELYVIIARQAGVDVGFVYGALFDQCYRGLQMTYAGSCASMSLGNVLQYRMIQWMTNADCLEYDLGSALPYKARWSDDRRHTEAYLVIS